MKLAEDHWAYLKRVLLLHGERDEVVEKIGFHYTTAFIHGYKHGSEAELENMKLIGEIDENDNNIKG